MIGFKELIILGEDSFSMNSSHIQQVWHTTSITHKWLSQEIGMEDKEMSLPRAFFTTDGAFAELWTEPVMSEPWLLCGHALARAFHDNMPTWVIRILNYKIKNKQKKKWCVCMNGISFAAIFENRIWTSAVHVNSIQNHKFLWCNWKNKCLWVDCRSLLLWGIKHRMR